MTTFWDDHALEAGATGSIRDHSSSRRSEASGGYRCHRQVGGNYLLAAKMFGIGKITIYRWVRIYGHDPPKDQAAALQAATPGGDGNGSKAPACDPLQPENQSVRPTPLGRRRSA